MDESVVTRVMPNSLEAEQSVVGSMIMDRQAIITAAEILKKDDFYHRSYGISSIPYSSHAKRISPAAIYERNFPFP